MKHLFDSKGRHIANLDGTDLYAPGGRHVGRQVQEGVFADLEGKYLGEVVSDDRLVYDPASPHLGTNFGAVAERRFFGTIAPPREYAGILMQNGRVDLDPDWFE